MLINLVLLFNVFFGIEAKAQEFDEINIIGHKFLTFSRKLPSDFLSTKVAVILSVPPDPKQPSERGDWRKLAKTVHPHFRKMGIDAVAYYYSDDLNSGKDPRKYFLAEMDKRKVKNLILLSETNRVINGKTINQYVLVITTHAGKSELYRDGQNAWKMQASDLKSILVELGKDVYRDKQPKTNFMITDVPEFFTTTDIIRGKRIPTYSKDLKVDKLAVSLFQKLPIPENIPEGSLNEKIKQEIEAYNAQVDRDNERLKGIMATYPLKYEISDKYTDEDLYNAGFDYVLLRLHTTGATIKELLGFKIDKSETDYITVKSNGIKRLSVNTPVHKYYVKHLYTKDIYVGGKWDADDSWEGALESFIENHLDALKVKKKK